MRSIRRTILVALLTSPVLFATHAAATQVQLSLLNTTITAKTAQGATLWSRPLTDCTAIGDMTSQLFQPPPNYKYSYTFANFSALSGHVGEFGDLSIPLLSLFALSTHAPANTTIHFQSTPTFQGGTYAFSAGTLSFTSAFGDDLTVNGGDLVTHDPGAFLYHGSDYPGPDRLFLEGTPILRVTVIPAPAGALTLMPLIAFHRRRAHARTPSHGRRSTIHH